MLDASDADELKSMHCCAKFAQDYVKLSTQEIVPNLLCLFYKIISLTYLSYRKKNCCLFIAAWKISLTFHLETSLILFTSLACLVILFTFLG